MGRENLEDYNANFFVMLERWQRRSFFAAMAAKSCKPLI